MSEHVLKAVAECWDAVKAGKKTFEVRKNDRHYQTGDTVILERWHTHRITKAYQRDFDAEPLRFSVGWILQGGQFGLEPGYCAFSLEPIQTKEPVPLAEALSTKGEEE